MKPPVALPALLALAALSSCAEVGAPERPAPYAYSITLPNGFQLIFRWPASALPMRVWVAEGGDLPRAVEDGLRLWEGVALYGEFRGVVVADSTQADVIVTQGDPEQPGPGAILACSAVTFWDVNADSTIALPFHMILRPRVGWSSGDVADCYHVVAAHELGHPLGLLLHSDDPADLMYGAPSVSAPSPRDRATFAVLYHTTPTVRLPAGR
jgi:hypothetical protein